MAAKKKVSIIYFCEGFCVSDVHEKRAKGGGNIWLIADGTKPTLTFTNGSPFTSNETSITIPKDTAIKRTLKIVIQDKTFPYTLECAPKCTRQDDNPTIIVEL